MPSVKGIAADVLDDSEQERSWAERELKDVPSGAYGVAAQVNAVSAQLNCVVRMLALLTQQEAHRETARKLNAPGPRPGPWETQAMTLKPELAFLSMLSDKEMKVVFAALAAMVQDNHTVQDNLAVEEWHVAEDMLAALEQRLTYDPKRPFLYMRFFILLELAMKLAVKPVADAEDLRERLSAGGPGRDDIRNVMPDESYDSLLTAFRHLRQDARLRVCQAFWKDREEKIRAQHSRR